MRKNKSGEKSKKAIVKALGEEAGRLPFRLSAQKREESLIDKGQQVTSPRLKKTQGMLGKVESIMYILVHKLTENSVHTFHLSNYSTSHSMLYISMNTINLSKHQSI